MIESRPLVGKVALVTGGGRGIGRAVSRTLARQGASVHVVARTAAELEETVRLITADGGWASATVADVSRTEAVFDVLKPRVEELSGPPHILVNAAGMFGPIALIQDGAAREWIETLQVNTIGPYLVCRAFIGGMIAAGWGRIVNVTSAASLHTPSPMNSAYATSKVALNHFTRSLAAELEGTGVTANVLHPGEVKTDMWRYIKEQAEILGVSGEPLRAWAHHVEAHGGDPPERAAELVAWLAGDAANSINGRFLWLAGAVQSPLPADWGYVWPADHASTNVGAGDAAIDG